MNRQQERIVQYMKRFGKITPLDAFRDLGITKLATRVSELKAEGYEFDQRRVSTENRFNETVTYMEYKLKSEPEATDSHTPIQ